MATSDVIATDLTKKTSSSMDGTESIIAFDSAEGLQMTVKEVGEYVLKKLTTSLNGSTQTVANALSSLNSEIKIASDTVSDFDDAYPSTTKTFMWYSVNQNMTNAPTISNAHPGGFLFAFNRTATYGVQIYVCHAGLCVRGKKNGTWTDWENIITY